MKRQITKLSPHQNGKIFGTLLAVVSLPLIIVIHMLMEYSKPATEQTGTLLAFPIFMYYLMPLIYFAIGYTSVALACLIYNFLHRFIGGFEFEIDESLVREQTSPQHRQKTREMAKRILPLTLLLAATALIITQSAQDIRISAIQEDTGAPQIDCGSLHGVALPCWDDYLSKDDFEGSESFPYYPYAKRPNGCSFPGAKPGTNDSIKVAGITVSFTDICNEHDRCYYTLDTTPWQCNSPFQNALRARCVYEFAKQAPNTFDLLTLGVSREEAQILCGVETMIIAGAVIGTQNSRHQLAQDRQWDYLARVDRFVEENRAVH